MEHRVQQYENADQQREEKLMHSANDSTGKAVKARDLDETDLLLIPSIHSKVSNSSDSDDKEYSVRFGCYGSNDNDDKDGMPCFDMGFDEEEDVRTIHNCNVNNKNNKKRFVIHWTHQSVEIICFFGSCVGIFSAFAEKTPAN